MLQIIQAARLDRSLQALFAGLSYRPTLVFQEIASALRIMANAVNEGFEARRKYINLRQRSVPHDAALREALDVSTNPRLADKRLL